MLSSDQIIDAIPHALLRADVPGLGPRSEGKVRDIYVQGDRRILITTDRVSAFDRVLGAIPFKGQVLNQLAAWWFEQTSDIVANHVIDVPDPNVTMAREAEALPVEVIVRGYITGVTSTALWTLYNAGVERPYGLDLPAGLRKNDPLPEPVITPTTKATGGAHDERLTSAEVVERGLVEPALWEEIQQAALAVFNRGQQVAAPGRADPGRHEIRVRSDRRQTGADRRGAYARLEPLLGCGQLRASAEGSRYGADAYSTGGGGAGELRQGVPAPLVRRPGIPRRRSAASHAA